MNSENEMFINSKDFVLEREGNMKGVFDQKKWAVVSKELEQESLKLASYDHTLIPLLGDLKGKKVLDYGGGSWNFSFNFKEIRSRR